MDNTKEQIKPFPTREEYPSGLSEAVEEWYKHTAENLDWDALETLIGLMRYGPLFDGDVPSKGGRDTLLKHRLCAKIIVSGRKMPEAGRPYTKPVSEALQKFLSGLGITTDNKPVKGYSWGYQAATYMGAFVYQAAMESGRIKP